MSERRDNGSHLLAIGRLLGHLDALEQWLGAIKVEAEEAKMGKALIIGTDPRAGDGKHDYMRALAELRKEMS